MSTGACLSCGADHGPAQRYCLACGALVGRRAVGIEQAIAYRHDRDPSPVPAPAPPTAPVEAASPSPSTEEPAPTPAADVSVWRRPVTSIATALALAAGVTVGFLTAPQGGVADGRTPVVASGPAPAPTTTADPATDPVPTDPAAIEPATTEESGDPASAPADGEPLPAAPSADDAVPPVSGDTGPSPAAAVRAPAKTKAKTKATAKPSAKRSTAAAKLPRIDHVWVIGIATPVAARDGGYLGEALLARGTELPKYAPVSTDPLIGAAALVAGREPSANAKTIVTRLTTAKRSWRAYAPGAPNCTDAPNGIPLLSFPTVTSAPDCADHLAGLADLTADLDAPPSFSYVATDPALDPAALDEQLKQVVEPIRRSAAFKKAGLIAIVPTAADPVQATGALLLSPFAAGSTSIGTAFGPYSLLRTVADLLGVDRPGHAADKDVKALGPDVLTPDD